ncbi:Ig-like domain-containing protein [Lachnospiraceae bacterium 45-W7]
MQLKRLKRYLSTFLAAAVILNTGAFDVMAAGSSSDTRVGESTNQAVSTPEKVYVDAYGVEGERSVSFNDHWRFYLGELNGAEDPSYNDASWKNVNLPHDYSIDQGHTVAAPAEPESGLMLGGTGWYRKAFSLPSEVAGKVVSVDFDGVYMNATVYLNGVQLGTHPYGYTPFSFVLPADVLKTNGEENMLAVKVENKLPSSRWYSGSGIYRDVKLTVTDSVHVSYFGTTVTTPNVDKEEAQGTVKIATSVKNDSAEDKNVSVRQTVYEKGSTEAVVTGEKTSAQNITAGQEAVIEAEVIVPNPKLWYIGTPNLYTVHTEVYVGEEVVDAYDSEFGFRWVEFTAENGFFLNGQNVKMKGVCMHHDQGALGGEAWYRATERQVEKLMQMGVNTIRVTHNPASQILIDICNEKGMLLIEEAFDCWYSGKNGNSEDYGKWFDRAIEEGNQIVGAEANEKWSEFDLKAMVKRGKNAPSIVMWSLGNEIFEGLISGNRVSEYPAMARQLITWVGEEDATRYVTYGDNKIKGGSYLETAAEIAKAHEYGVPGGVVGYNYANTDQVKSGHDRGWLVYGSETASSINSRGIYDRKNNGGDGGKGDRMLTSYDKSKVGWGALASEGMWVTMRQNFNAGEFIWTGFDYIGEPTPYNGTGTVGAGHTWPNMAKSSYFGIIDLAGFPKDSFYLYQSQWNDDLHTLHVLPVWNRDEIMVDNNGKVEVVVYSDAPVIKLYLNGREVGSATAARTETPTGGYQNYTSGTGCFDAGKASGHTSLYATFNVPYEAGKLEAKAYDAEGNEITNTDGRSIVETTKNATKLTAEADRTEITADGKDLSYITIDAVDQDGKFVNGAEPEITVSVEGNGVLMALDNGVQNDTSGYSGNTKKAGKGKLLAIVQSTKKAGTFTVNAQADGFTKASVTVKTTADNSASKKSIENYEISRHYYVKKGAALQLPASVKVNYTDGTSESKSVVWDSLPSEDQFVVYGSVAGTSLRIPVYVTVIEDVAAILNYSAAIGVGSDFTLPETRPAVLPDGTVLSAEFPVTWSGEVDSSEEGTQTITGTSSVFGKSVDVSASIRVTKGAYKDGSDVLANVAELYINGISSKERDSVAEVLTKLTDDKISNEDAAWSGRGTIDFRLDTAISLKDITLYLKDPTPISSTMKIYSSGDKGDNWKQAECTISNRRLNGVTVRTFTPKETVSETDFRVEFTQSATLVEMEVNTRIPTFPIGGEAALSSLRADTYIADAATLSQGWFGVSDQALGESDIKAVGKDNASVTILPKDAEDVVRILLESEDHSVRDMYQVYFGVSNDSNDNAADDSLDYPYADMTLSAVSYHSTEPPEKANDGNNTTKWHSSWGANGSTGPSSLTDLPEKRYLQMKLDSAKKITGLRYLPRPRPDKNGIVLKYQVRVSNQELTDEEWMNQKVVAEGTWNDEVVWKLAKFNKAVEAQYVRLYGVQTHSDGVANAYMSAAEVRLRKPQQELSSKNTTVSFAEGAGSLDYTGSELRPEPTVVYNDGTEKTLVKGTDYELDYRNNVEPGKATVIVKGTGIYTGIVEAEFTIRAVQETIDGYEAVSVTTGKGVYPELPGTVIANTNFGQKVMEVQWDRIAASRLNKFGTFRVQGTVIETDAQVSAEVTVCDIIGIKQVTLTTVEGIAPQMPEKVTVYYSNDEIEERNVTWDLSEVSFEKAGIVKVNGTVGRSQTEASVRVEKQADTSTPAGENLALNENGVNKPKQWPRTFAYYSSGSDRVHNATDGVKDFVTDSSKKIWCDWERGVYHTNADAAVGANDHLPFVVSAFGKKGSEANDDQKKYMINKVRLGFTEEDGSSANKVRLPQGYKIEYYSADAGVIPASRISNDSANECSNVKGWGADNPIKDHSSWTEVTYINKTAVPPLDDFKRMVDVEFEPVATTAVRITLQPQANNWTGLEEFEVYYEPVSKNDNYTVTAINVDGVNKLADFNADTKTLEVDAKDGVITAEADNNASITVFEAVNGTAKVMFLPENGDEAKKQEYTIVFKKAGSSDGMHLVTAKDEMVEIDLGEAAQGETVTFSPKEGYEFTEEPALIKSTDRTPSGLAIKKADGSYSFEMPDYPVTITGQTCVKTYQITYHLDGGQAANRANYTVETPYFTLNMPSRENYVFLGWTGNGITEPTIDVTIAQGTTGDLEFTAHWREGRGYRITFDTDGAGEVEPQEVAVDSGMITEPEMLKKHGYDFVGWFSDAKKTKQWDFAKDKADRDMTLYAKWEEGKITVNTKIVHYTGEAFEMPGKLNITIAGETFDTDVSWNAQQAQVVESATEIGMYTVAGTLSDPEGRVLEIQVPVSPSGIVYYLDNGAAEFTDKGKAVVEGNKNLIKNKNAQGKVVPDGAYSAESGWGYTNPDNEVGASQTGDAYVTIRHMTNPGGHGKTLSYQFDNLPAGKYVVTAGFFDPWAQYVGDNRHAKVTLTDAEGNELASKADHHISGDKDTVTFENIKAARKGSVTLNIAPINNTNEDCDVMVSFIVIQGVEFDEVPITEIKAEESAKTLAVGETYQIQASVGPEDTTDDQTLEYASSKEEVATVDEKGVVTAVAAGETEIEISSKARPNVKTIVKIEVTQDEKPKTQIKVKETAKTVLIGKTYQINASLENAQEGDALKYVSSKKEVATVDENGLVTAVAVGTADIEISCDREDVSPVTVEITVTDHEILITGIKVKETETSIEAGKTYQIEASVEPEDTTEDMTLEYQSSDEEVATVDENGLVTAIAEGEAEIEISSKARPNVKTTVKIKVTERSEQPDTQITVEETAKTVLIGKTYQIKASLKNAQEGDTLKYQSSDEGVATVDEKGLVTAVAEGTADIEVSCSREGVSPVTVEITVTDHRIPITRISVEETETSIKVGESYQIKASVEPDNTTEDTTLTYISKHPDIAEVDEKGLVTAQAEGEADIEISCVNPDVEKVIVTVTVMKEDEENPVPITEIKVKETEKTIEVGTAYQIEAWVEPEDTTEDDTLTYTSGNINVATVSEEGLVTAIAAGTAEIQVTCARTDVAPAKVAITVTAPNVNPDIATPEQRGELTNRVNDLKAAYQDLSKYTAASAEAFRNALAAAEYVLANPNATAAEVQLALNNLAAAQAGLTFNPTETAPQPPKKGYKFKVGSLQYQVTKSSAKNGTVSVVKLMKKTSKKITIPATVKVKVKGQSFTFKVTQINSKVFQNNKKLKEVIIGANITKIGTKSFYGCKNLGKITFKGTIAPKAGSKAFTGIKKNAKVYVPKKVSKSNLKKFKTTMKTAGKKITIKKK